MSARGKQEQSTSTAKLKEKQKQAVSIPKTSIEARGGFVESTQNLPLHKKIDILGKTIIVPAMKLNPSNSQILKDFRKGVKERQNIESNRENHSVTIPKKDIIVVGQVAHNENFKKPSTDLIKKGQPRYSRENQNGPNGTGPILERVIVQDNSQMQPTINQKRIRGKQNQLFAELEMRNLDRQTMEIAFQRPEDSNYHQNGVDLENLQIDSSFQDGVNNQELGLSHSLERISALRHTQDFYHKKDLCHQKQHRQQQFSEKAFVFQAQPTERFKDDQVRKKIPEQFPPEKHGRHPNLPWSAESAASAWPPSQPHALGDQPPRPDGKRPSKQALAMEATCKLPRQCVTYPTRPAILSLTEQVASIGQNSRPNLQQQRKSHFDAHHDSAMHSYMLSKWSLNQLQQRFPDHVIDVPENLDRTNAGSNEDVPENEYFTTRPQKPTPRASTSEPKANLAKIQDRPSTNINLPDADLDTLPIQWDPTQPIPGMTIEELNQQYACNAAMSGIKK